MSNRNRWNYFLRTTELAGNYFINTITNINFLKLYGYMTTHHQKITQIYTQKGKMIPYFLIWPFSSELDLERSQNTAVHGIQSQYLISLESIIQKTKSHMGQPSWVSNQSEGCKLDFAWGIFITSKPWCSQQKGLCEISVGVVVDLQTYTPSLLIFNILRSY